LLLSIIVIIKSYCNAIIFAIVFHKTAEFLSATYEHHYIFRTTPPDSVTLLAFFVLSKYSSCNLSLPAPLFSWLRSLLSSSSVSAISILQTPA
jgi:hypothetical protein